MKQFMEKASRYFKGFWQKLSRNGRFFFVLLLFLALLDSVALYPVFGWWVIAVFCYLVIAVYASTACFLVGTADQSNAIWLSIVYVGGIVASWTMISWVVGLFLILYLVYNVIMSPEASENFAIWFKSISSAFDTTNYD